MPHRYFILNRRALEPAPPSIRGFAVWRFDEAGICTTFYPNRNGLSSHGHSLEGFVSNNSLVGHLREINADLGEALLHLDQRLSPLPEWRTCSNGGLWRFLPSNPDGIYLSCNTPGYHGMMSVFSRDDQRIPIVLSFAVGEALTPPELRLWPPQPVTSQTPQSVTSTGDTSMPPSPTTPSPWSPPPIEGPPIMNADFTIKRRVHNRQIQWSEPISQPSESDIEAATTAIMATCYPETATTLPFSVNHRDYIKRLLEDTASLKTLSESHVDLVARRYNNRAISYLAITSLILSIQDASNNAYFNRPAMPQGGDVPRPPIARIKQELQAIADYPNARISATELSFTTGDVILEGRNFGRFLITLNYSAMKGRNFTSASFALHPLEPYYGLQENSSSLRSSNPHPNISGGTLCFGTSEQHVVNMLKRGNFSAAADTIPVCLHTGYLNQTPYVKYYMWPIARQPNPVPEGTPPPTHRDAKMALQYQLPSTLMMGAVNYLNLLSPETGCPLALPPPQSAGTGPNSSNTTVTNTRPSTVPPTAELTPGSLPPNGWSICAMTGFVCDNLHFPDIGGIDENGNFICYRAGYFCLECNEWHANEDYTHTPPSILTLAEGAELADEGPDEGN